MKTRLLPEHGNGSFWRVLALSCLASSSVYSQSGYSYPPPPGYVQPSPQHSAPSYPAPPPPEYQQPGYQTEYVSPVEFLPTFGRKFGNMFRRVFYGDTPPAEYHAPQGHAAQPGRSLDNAPPSYQSHYGQQPPPRYQEQPQYQQPAPQNHQPVSPSTPQRSPYQQAPQYQTPPLGQRPLQYEVPPPARTTPPNSRMGTQPAPRTSLKSKETPLPKTSSTPKKYTPPTLTKKSQPKLEEMPPPAENKTTSAANEPEYYPLPGAKPESKMPSKSTASSPSSTSKSDTKSAGNNGSFLKGKRASKPGRVISPYPPYQELDITGLNSGSLALDPTTQKVFEVP